MYGVKPTHRMTRLLAPVSAKGTKITVAKDLAWKVGDRIWIAPTSFNQAASDYGEIKAYDTTKGEIELKAPLKFYHYGAATSTAATYNNVVDIRAEIVLLTRNIRIVGDNTDKNKDWGGQMVTSDYLEVDGTQRNGETVLSAVEFQNCGQKNTFYAAIRFEGAFIKNQIVDEVVAHTSNGWNLNIYNAYKVSVTNSFFIGSKSIGGSIAKAKDITFTNNLIGDVQPRTVNALGMAIDFWACLAVCSYPKFSGTCSTIKVQNNIAAGCKFAGFVTPGHKCGDFSEAE